MFFEKLFFNSVFLCSKIYALFKPYVCKTSETFTLYKFNFVFAFDEITFYFTTKHIVTVICEWSTFPNKGVKIYQSYDEMKVISDFALD